MNTKCFITLLIIIFSFTNLVHQISANINVRTENKSIPEERKIKKIPVYHGPGTYMGLAGRLKEGKKIILTGREQTDWIEFIYNNKKYWMKENDTEYFVCHKIINDQEDDIYFIDEGKDLKERADKRREEFFGEKTETKKMPVKPVIENIKKKETIKTKPAMIEEPIVLPNEVNGNHAAYLQARSFKHVSGIKVNWQAYWGSYEKEWARLVGINIKVRNMLQESDTFKVEWYFIAGRRNEFIYDSGQKIVELGPGAFTEFNSKSKILYYERNEYKLIGVTYIAGAKLKGWYVRVMAGDKLLADEASSVPLQKRWRRKLLEEGA